jgi:hypothetical protein
VRSRPARYTYCGRQAILKLGGMENMLVVQGYFEEGQFISNNKVVIPEHRRAIVTVLDEKTSAPNHKKIWKDFFTAIQSANEDIPANFPRVSFNRKLDI